MRKLKIIFVMILTTMCFNIMHVSAAGVATMLLEYDGAVHDYSGSVYDLEVNGNEIVSPMEPIIFNDRALVPVREVCEELGAKVTYEDKQIELFMDSNYIRLKINDNVVYVNGKKELIPDNVVPKLIAKAGSETKTMVPVRFISETLGFNVDFDGMNERIKVTSPDYVEQTPIPTAEPTAIPTAEPTAAPTAAPVTQTASNKISGIWYTKISDSVTRINISSSEAFPAYEDFTLSDPARVVIDAYNCGITRDISEKYSIGVGSVDSVRVGDHGDKIRMVIDLNSYKGYSVSKSDNGRILYVDITGKVSSTPEPTKKPSVSETPKPTQKPSSTKAPSDSKLIVLDAGHGGKDGGAEGTLDGKRIYEKDLTLAIMKKTQAVLESNGYSVEVTRSSDTYPELVERSALANEKGAAAFVSIHINSVDNSPTASGTEVYFSELNNGNSFNLTSKQMAKNILDEMMKRMDTRNRGVKSANHVVTRTSNMPAVLVEVGFISNEEELRKMCDDSFQQKIAEGIAAGIMKSADNIVMPSK